MSETGLQQRDPRAAGRREARGQLRPVADQLLALRRMSTAELRAKFEELFGQPTTCCSPAQLRKRLAWRIQEQAEGGLSERALARIAELQRETPLEQIGAQKRARQSAEVQPPTADRPGPSVIRPARDPRLPPAGTVLRREHGGRTHEVTVLDKGFEYGGQRFRSLSGVARQITGTNWNGLAFFHLAHDEEG